MKAVSKHVDAKMPGPKVLSMILELRFIFDLVTVPFSLLASRLAKKSGSDSFPIVMIPGFRFNEWVLKALECYLQNLGYRTEGWGLGTNGAGLDLEHTIDDLYPVWGLQSTASSPQAQASYQGEGSVALLCQNTVARIRQRSKELGSPVIIIGWSLGGYIARECARELPDEVAKVITLGAPVVGGPKYTRAVEFFRARNLDIDWIEASIAHRDSTLIQQPITSIYSKSDGVVSLYAALDTISPNVENIEVNSSHWGMGFNRNVWRLISDALSTYQKRSSFELHNYKRL